MEIVRKKLTPDDLSPSYLRYNAEDDVVQITGDNGATWQDAPQLDPRTTNQFAPMSGGDVACDAATRMVAAIEEVVTALINAINGGAGFAALQGILMGWLAVFGFFFVLVALAALVIAIFVAIGYVALYAAFSTFNWDELACKIRCYVNSDGRLDADTFAEVKAMIADDYDSTQSTVLNAILDLTGFGALNAFAASRTETGDCGGCDGCEWCWEWDAADIATPGLGWSLSETVVGAVAVTSALAVFDATIFHAEFTYTTSGIGTWVPTDTADEINATPEGDLVRNEPATEGGATVTWEGDDTAIEDITVAVGSRYSDGSYYPVITHVLIRGRGTLPAFASGSEC